MSLSPTIVALLAAIGYPFSVVLGIFGNQTFGKRSAQAKTGSDEASARLADAQAMKVQFDAMQGLLTARGVDLDRQTATLKEAADEIKQLREERITADVACNNRLAATESRHTAEMQALEQRYKSRITEQENKLGEIDELNKKLQRLIDPTGLQKVPPA